MSRAANYCEDCRHSSITDETGKSTLICKHGHKPKFYVPKTHTDAIDGNYGWKRKCEDYEEI